jgi:glc operon protein GlcG
MKAIQRMAGALLVCAVAVPSNAQVTEKKALALEGAKRVIAAAVAEAHGKNAPGAAIAVVDEGGNLMALERLDNTFAAGANISIGKARTAAIFQRPTSGFENIIKDGRTAMVALSDFTPLQGGVPIVVGNQVVGAIGVSGAASAQQDEEIAVAGAKAVAGGAMATATPSSSVTYLDAEKVTAAFAKGMPLLETDGYKIHASRREKPGEAEIHAWETDVIYVLDGTAIFVTGGTAADPRTIAPGEIRGKEIQGGQVHRLTKGDVFVVPRGVPHWFKEIPQAPFLYFVVKPISRGGMAP